MAKSSKPRSRKRTVPAKAKDNISDAVVVNEPDASERTEQTAPSKADDVEAAVDGIGDTDPDHEPMDSEVDDTIEATVVEDTGSTDANSTDEYVDADAEAAAEPRHDPEQAAPVPAPLMSERATSGGLFPSILGGVIAGAIGFVAALLIFPDGWREQDNSVVTSLQSGLADQKDNLVALTDQVGELGGRIDGTVETLQTEISERTGATVEAVGALRARLDRLSEGDGTVALPDEVQVLLNAQKEKLDALTAEVAGMADAAKAQMQEAVNQQETAEQAEARVKARGAMQVIRLAMISGDPYEEALADVAPAVKVPDGLQAAAAEGVPTQTDIISAYPAAARAALSKAVREEAGDDTQSRISLFFKDQLGARSLTPRDGDDADAILSRAEAAVKAEDLAGALNEIEALPDGAKAEFADWQAQASARLAAVDGFDTVSAALNGN